MPSPVTYSAPAPRATWPVWLITESAAMIAGATHAVTMSADSAPMTNVPTNVPDFCWLLTFVSRVCNALGKAHGANPNSDAPPKFPFLEDGVGQQTPPNINKPGDSGITGKGKKGEFINLPVTAPAGTKLWMICLIHPWMQAEIDVT